MQTTQSSFGPPSIDAAIIATLDHLAIEAVPLVIERARRLALLASELRLERAAREVVR